MAKNVKYVATASKVSDLIHSYDMESTSSLSTVMSLINIGKKAGHEMVDEITLQLLAQLIPPNPQDFKTHEAWLNQKDGYWVALQIVTNTFRGFGASRPGMREAITKSVSWLRNLTGENFEDNEFAALYAESICANLAYEPIDRKESATFFEIQKGRIAVGCYE